MKANRTFIDGTTVCPVCRAEMTCFQYDKNTISNARVKTDWQAWKKITSWTETTYGRGIGFMCLDCYKKRARRFWLVFGLLLLMLIAAIATGAVFSLKPLLYTGLGGLAVMLILFYSRDAKEFYDLEKAIRRHANPTQEFASRLVREHPDEFQRNDIIRATRL
ncbi:MAG: hypothetical protein QM270_01860 [Bacillota bacterium]|nr:hypothetical protein [Bacillota bacterium]